MNRKFLTMVGLLVVAVALVACGDDEEAAPAVAYDVSQQPANAATMFVAPQDGETISGPVAVEMAAEGVNIVAAAAPVAGEAHFHIMVNAACLATGETIPGPSPETTEQGFRHFGTGVSTAELELEPGTYELCLQLADGAHVAFGTTQTITVTVE